MLKRELSGPDWCDRFPTSRSTGSLVEPFQRHVEQFITALEAAGCVVRIHATRRPAERAWLMRQAWDIVRACLRPERAPVHEDIPIKWEHPSYEASIDAARQMVATYGLVVRPSLSSRHIEGRAIDMSISRPKRFEAVNGAGHRVTVSTEAELYALGASYGVHKLVSDVPHWSDDGR